MIETLISSKTRVKLLLKFFLNTNNEGYLRMLEDEFQESTNSIRLELNRFEQANMLESELQGNKKVYRANNKHPLFTDLKAMVYKHVGLDSIVDNIINKLGELQKIYVTGSFSKGLDSSAIDLVFIGDVNEQYLAELIVKCQGYTARKINYVVYKTDLTSQLDTYKKYNNNYMLLWSV